jgi:hypothetical protein
MSICNQNIAGLAVFGSTFRNETMLFSVIKIVILWWMYFFPQKTNTCISSFMDTVSSGTACVPLSQDTTITRLFEIKCINRYITTIVNLFCDNGLTMSHRKQIIRWYDQSISRTTDLLARGMEFLIDYEINLVN